jgi:hypothetical protein
MANEKEIVLNLNKSQETKTKSDKVLDLTVKCLATTANGEQITVGFANILTKIGASKSFMEKLRSGEITVQLEIAEDSSSYYESLEF